MSNDRRGLLLVISSPSGAGKTSLSRRLMGEFPELALSVSATTRPARPGEMDGREYHFVAREQFEAMAAAGEFLEWAQVHGNLYGSPRAPVMARLDAGLDVLFDIDWQGAQAIRASAGADTVQVFILPPDLAALERRLHSRAQDSDAVIAARLAEARREIGHWDEYDYVIVNDDFEEAYRRLAAVYLAERERPARNPWLGPFVEGLLAEA